MWIYFMLFGAVLSAPADEIKNVLDEGELYRTDQMFLKPIVPSGYSPYGNGKETFQLSYIFPEDNKYYATFNEYFKRGITMKGLTFNIYDDSMRNAAIALFELIRNTRKTEKSNFDKLLKWINYNVNSDMVDYASRLGFLFDTSTSKKENFLPPFLVKPNYFVGGETIFKAFYISDKIGKIAESIFKTYQILNIDGRSFAINSNYSGWNMPLHTCDKQIKYFTEDIALNSYYYGLQLLHPFWMTNEELDALNPRHAEHYYFAHKQLYARYLLEKDHLPSDEEAIEADCEPEYSPHLYYDNGLPFPSRCEINDDDKEGNYNYLETKDLEIKESIHRGAYTENGTIVVLTEDNYMNLLARLVRSQMNNIKNAKITRSVYSYRTSGYLIDKYNPAPSILHHPQTTLREPIYWYLIKKDLDYFALYANNTEPYDLTKYERNDFTISNIETITVSTNFQYYLINLYKSMEGDKPLHVAMTMPYVYARQRRINHEPFTLKFTIESKLQKDVTIRLFLGPSCSINHCWDLYYKFFQLDCYRHNVKVGTNIITWTTESSSKYYSDHNFNKTVSYEQLEENYDIFKFPESLVIPKGRKEGLNFTIFIMIDDEDVNNDFVDSSLYMQVTGSISNKPLGFPFHRQADKDTVNDNALNYRFYNISVFHKASPPDSTGYFSPNIY
ncbi:hypothetical protein evm_000475 [Chilo suppressalis]|nr:hypothetical protein evm_000475 [Chilo suppressalis]